MAEIPVEKRSGSKSWLWILLALLLLGLLAWWLLSDDGDEVEYIDDTTTAAVAPVTTGEQLVVGQQVNMEAVEVTSLAGDMAFYIDVNGERVPVFFDQVPTPGTATEGRYDINPGNLVNITGEVRQSTDPLPANADPSILGDAQHYIYATNLEPVG